MELANRLELESKLAGKLSRLYGSHRRKIVAALKSTGNPPDATKIPASLWREIESETEQQLAEEILLIYLLALAATSSDLSLGLKSPTQKKMGDAYATGRAKDIAKKMTDHSRERLEGGGDPLEIFGPDRAATVARSEIGVAQSYGSLDAVRSPEGEEDRKAAEVEQAEAEADQEQADASDDQSGNRGGKKKESPKAKPKARLFVAYWRHSHIRPRGHAGAAVKPCPICTPRLNKPESQWGGLVPGEAHPHCVLPGTIVSARGVVAATSVLYEGPAVRITVGGRDFSVTEQHKFLGSQGFVSAGSLDKGDYLIGCRFSELMPFKNPYNHYGPAQVEKIISSFSEANGMLPRSVPSSAKDFDGDAVFFKSNVDVVYSHRLLRHAPKSSPLKHGHKLPLCASWDDHILSRLGSLDTVLAALSLAAHGTMGCSSLLEPFIRAHESSPNYPGHGAGTGTVACLDHCSLENGAAYAQTLRGLQERFPATVSLDQIENVERFNFQGHVYDLQTESGLYEIDGVLSSNCDCYPEFVALIDNVPVLN